MYQLMNTNGEKVNTPMEKNHRNKWPLLNVLLYIKHLAHHNNQTETMGRGRGKPNNEGVTSGRPVVEVR